MRKNLLIGTAVAFLVCAAGWGWFMMSHPHSVHAIATGWKQSVWRHHDAGACPNEPAQQLIEIEPLSVAEKMSVPESTDPVEVIDLTELQRVPQPPVETVEPPLATEVPAVFRELPSSEPAVKSANHDVPSEPLPPESSNLPIPIDFLLHSADGWPPLLDSISSSAAQLNRRLHGEVSERKPFGGPSNLLPTGYDRIYHQQHPGCTYMAGSSFDRVPELLPEPTLLPKAPGADKKDTRHTLEMLPGDLPSFWMVTPF